MQKYAGSPAGQKLMGQMILYSSRLIHFCDILVMPQVPC